MNKPKKLKLNTQKAGIIFKKSYITKAYFIFQKLSRHNL